MSLTGHGVQAMKISGAQAVTFWLGTFLLVFSSLLGKTYADERAPLTVCELLEDLKSHSGSTVVVRDEVFAGPNVFALANTECDSPFIPEMTEWPSVINLAPRSPHHPAGPALKQKILDGHRRRKNVRAQATFIGKLTTPIRYRLNSRGGTGFGLKGKFPAELVFDEIKDISVQLEPLASDLPVIQICELMTNLEAYRGQRIAVQGIPLGNPGVTGLSGNCEAPVVLDEVKFSPALHIDYSHWHLKRDMGVFGSGNSPRTGRTANERPRDNSQRVKKVVTYVGRLQLREQYVTRRSETWFLRAYGPKMRYPAQLQFEAITNVVTEPVGPEYQEPSGPGPPGSPPPAVSRDCGQVKDLIEAAGLGCTDVVVQLLSKGADPNHVTGMNRTPLKKAIEGHHLEVAELLIKAGANVDDTSAGTPPLCRAVESGDIQAVELLIRNRASVDRLPGKSCVPLVIAAESGRGEIVGMLLQAGAELEARDRGDETALHEAALRGHLGTMQQLLAAGADPDARWAGNTTMLFILAARGTGARELIDAGADVNFAYERNGITPLMRAARNGLISLMKDLLQAGAQVDAQDKKGLTPLMHAVEGGQPDATRLLVEVGADIHKRTYIGTTVFHLNTSTSAPEILKILQEQPRPDGSQ